MFELQVDLESLVGLMTALYVLQILTVPNSQTLIDLSKSCTTKQCILMRRQGDL